MVTLIVLGSVAGYFAGALGYSVFCAWLVASGRIEKQLKRHGSLHNSDGYIFLRAITPLWPLALLGVGSWVVVTSVYDRTERRLIEAQERKKLPRATVHKGDRDAA